MPMITNCVYQFLLISSVSILHVITSVPFVLNPNCSLDACRMGKHGNLFYGYKDFDEDRIHVMFSSFDQLTISLVKTRQEFVPIFDYVSLMTGNYSGAINFIGTQFLNSFSLMIRRLIEFDDETNTIVNSYWLNQCQTNMTMSITNYDQPTYFLPLDDIHGQLVIDIQYPGEKSRDSQLPRQSSTNTSYFLNIALQADNLRSAKIRFALEFYVFQLSYEGTELVSSSFLDDQATPGVFAGWQLKSLSPVYITSLLWKPVVYQSRARAVDEATTMIVNSSKNHVVLDPQIDRGIFNSLYLNPDVTAFNVSLGRSDEDFFDRTKFAFIQLTGALEILEFDSLDHWIILSIIVTSAIPVGVTLIGFCLTCIKRCKYSDS